MKIKLNSIFVKDQTKALRFYTETLGFIKKRDIPMGAHHWLTVVAADEQGGPELVLEPLNFPPAAVYQKALYDAGIPATAFQVENLQYEFQRLKNLYVKFSMEPTIMGVTKLAVFDDTCGNRIQLFEVL